MNKETPIPVFTIIVSICIVLLLFATCVSCTTSVSIREGKIEANSSNVVAEQTVKPDGEIQTKIDTTNRTWWDKIKTGINSTGRFIGSTVGDNTQYTIE